MKLCTFPAVFRQAVTPIFVLLFYKERSY